MRKSFIGKLSLCASFAILIASTTARAEIIETPADESNSVTVPAPASPPTALPAETPIQPSVSKIKPKSHSGVHRHVLTVAPEPAIEVEPAQAALPLMTAATVFAAPSPNAKVIETLKSGAYVKITGSTATYLRIDTTGHAGYINATAVDLVKPSDHVFHLATDSPVYSQPNRWGTVVAQVHQGHDVHVVGSALSYVKVQMKSGLEGFVPMTALQ